MINESFEFDGPFFLTTLAFNWSWWNSPIKKALEPIAIYKTATTVLGMINAFVTHLFKPVCLHLCSTAIYIDLFYCLACGHDIESTLSSTVDSLPSQQWSNHHASVHQHSQAFRTRSSRQFIVWRALQEPRSHSTVREISSCRILPSRIQNSGHLEKIQTNTTEFWSFSEFWWWYADWELTSTTRS